MSTIKIWAVVPAAGVGRRLGAVIPKQYLDLAGRPVIEWTLDTFLADARISGVRVALGPEDGFWSATAYANHPKVRRVAGGAERCHSVLNALDDLAAEADLADWVLVHDAARPCLRQADLDRLITALADDPVGGILGVPVRDTMKGANPDGRIRATIDRAALWHAFTPQMFRLGALRDALRAAINAGDLVTDDASAMELSGLSPRLIEGHADNIKITRAEDLPLARFYLDMQARSC
ncbi:MAG: 2-C-methyl-D-erythritol 4-phosphate cytidylyltransferase [Lamprocystis purpurea]|uniref:2-C-methyl-D-erythritol 4-phosphate cytidylyltransferase n=1 Tax=Lamprocystis purpurea TaxID=61598 RepID=UPI000A037E7D|nr:2-C-methyl-D-erythritol 4-phosphate cytidylyltransferase [Lamprocystis purpurea]MBV5275332.1 2-C-methyl-D-erythritol 4-phosphate cytidylyltransferase [Lamprocystis purpurea]